MIPRDTIKTVILVTILSLAQLSILISSTDPVLADGGSFGRDFDTIQSFLNTIDEVLIRDRRSTDRKTSKENGLVGYWPMYENSSDIVHDLSGNLNNGTLVNMDANTSWMEGIAVTGTALAFDGVNDHVSIPHSPSLNITGNITVELWAKMAREAPPPSYLPPSGTPIYDVSDLQNMSNDLNGTYYLANDINASETLHWNDGAGFEPVGIDISGDEGFQGNPFNGMLNGRGHTISSLYINRPALEFIGLFGYTNSSAQLRDVDLVSVNISGSRDNTSVLVGWNNGGAITNCSSTGRVDGADNIGGLVGGNSGNITGCYSATSPRGSRSVGGLVGANGGNITNCSSCVSVVGLSGIGGLVGLNYGTIKDCHSAGSIDCMYIDEVGYVQHVFGHCGGLVGMNTGTIISCHSTSYVLGIGAPIENVGGLVGYNMFGTITTSYSNGDVVGEAMVGGLVGTNEGSITSCYSSSETWSDGRAGGLAGMNGGTIDDSYSTGSVTGGVAGGLVGTNKGMMSGGTITCSYSTGRVTGESKAGGLVGANSGGGVTGSTISNSYSTGNVTGGDSVGGLVGYASDGGSPSTITNSYSTGSVTGTDRVGGLVGWNSDLKSCDFTACFWDNQTSGQTTGVGTGPSSGVSGRNTSDMKQSATYSGWALSSIWWIYDGVDYPFLQWEFHGEPLVTKGMDAYMIQWDPGYASIRGVIDNTMITAVLPMPENWHHIALTYNRTAILLYIDGVLEKTVPYNGGVGWNGSPLKFGGDNHFFEGVLDEVRLWNRSLSSVEVLASYQQPPIITTSFNDTATEDVPYSVAYKAEDINRDVLTWNFTANASWLGFDDETGILSGTPANRDVGLFWINMSVTDGHGGADWKNFTLSVLNVNDVPVITTEVDTDVFDGMTYLVDFDAFDVDPTIDILTWNVTTNGSWLIFNETTGVLNGTPMNVDIGWYYVDINVDDGNGGRDWLNYTLTVMNMNDEPIITTTDNVTAIEDMRYNIDYDAIDADPTNDTLEWSLYTDAAWLEINASTGILNGTPTNADVGSYRVMIKVVDGQGEFATREFLLNVKNINDAPVILTMDKMDATEDKFYSRYYNADDIDITGDTLNWSLTTNAFWLALADNHLHGMPGNEEVGSFWVNVTVADGQGGSDWTNFTLSVYPDFDGDGLNDTVDPDDDNDGVNDTQDDFPFDANESTDNDGDGIGDNGDDDDDNDGWNDTFENLVGTDALNNNSIPTDTDGDLTPDTLDGDDDNDGWSDQEEDIYGTDALDNSSAPLDTDNDGTPDAWDQDDDGDDWADSIEVLVGTDPLDGSSVPSDEDGDGVADLVDADFKKGLAGEAEAETPAWAYIVLILMIIGWLVALLMISRGRKKPTEAVEAEEKKGDIEHEIWEPGEEEEGEYEEEEEEIEVAENLEEESVPEEGLETSGVTTEEVKEEEEVEKGPEENEAAIKDVQKRMKKVKHYYKNKKISKKKYVHLMKKYKRMLKEDQAERGIKPEEGTLEEEPEVKEEVEVEPEELAVVEKAEDRGEAAEGEEKETVEAEEEEEVEEADEIEEEAVKEDAEEVDEKEGVEEANEEIAILKVIIEEEDEEEEGIYTEEIR